ncbi:hypothetical protein AAG906_016668 [Vitis piasezkii]
MGGEMMKKGVSREREEAMEKMTERLSCKDNLYFPRALEATATTPPQRKSILLDLLSRDPAVFLAQEFDSLKDDYEVCWHLKHIRSVMSPTSEELKSRSVAVKNRRRAYLNKLIYDGQYFSEDAMRRENHICITSMWEAGERWSETLLRRSEEAILVAKIRGSSRGWALLRGTGLVMRGPSKMKKKRRRRRRRRRRKKKRKKRRRRKGNSFKPCFVVPWRLNILILFWIESEHKYLMHISPLNKGEPSA